MRYLIRRDIGYRILKLWRYIAIPFYEYCTDSRHPSLAYDQVASYRVFHIISYYYFILSRNFSNYRNMLQLFKIRPSDEKIDANIILVSYTEYIYI